MLTNMYREHFLTALLGRKKVSTRNTTETQSGALSYGPADETVSSQQHGLLSNKQGRLSMRHGTSGSALVSA